MTRNHPEESDSDVSIYQQLVERYQVGELPWDSEVPPPEVIDLVSDLKPGRALDLGCGFGRASIFLASRGWAVDAVDFISQAITEAITRAQVVNVSDRIGFHVASVTDLGFLKGTYDFALDVGCLHVLSEPERQAYYRELLRLLPAGARFLLFARLRQPEAEKDNEFRGLTESDIRTLFANGFVLDRVERGETQLPDGSAWASAWFWYRRATTRCD